MNVLDNDIGKRLTIAKLYKIGNKLAIGFNGIFANLFKFGIGQF